MRNNKTVEVKKKGGDDMDCNYAIGANNTGRPIWVHEYGDWVSFSDERGDYLMAVRYLAPYATRGRFVVGTEPAGDPVILRTKDSKTVRVDMGMGRFQDQTVLTGGESAPFVYQPMQDVVEYRDTTPPVTRWGKPIKIGDRVSLDIAASGTVTGELTELNSSYLVITNEKGKHFIPWQETSSTNRVTRA